MRQDEADNVIRLVKEESEWCTYQWDEFVKAIQLMVDKPQPEPLPVNPYSEPQIKIKEIKLYSLGDK